MFLDDLSQIHPLSGSGDTNQVLQHASRVFKESDWVHACPAVATPQQREEWNHKTCDAVVTDTEGSDLDDEESGTPLLI